MANMFNKYEWKQTIYKDDLINVIINGIVAAILGGILAGALDYLFSLLKIIISFGLVILAYLIGYRVKKGYFSFHIIYPVLSILFLTLGLLFSFFMQNLMLFNFNFIALMQQMPSLLYEFFIMPFVYPILAIKNGDVLNFFIYLINVLCYALAYYLCYRISSVKK